MKKFLLFFITLVIVSLSEVCYANPIDYINKKVTIYNDSGKFEESIKLLKNVINNPKSSNYEIYNAYLQKYIIYKRLFNYAEAVNNLNLAEKFGLKSDQVDEVKIRIQIERLFVEFDSLRFDEVTKMLPKIDESKLNLVDDETHAFYLLVVGTMHQKNQNYALAEKYFDQSIEIIKVKSPKHLPNVYRKKISLYTQTNEKEKALASFDIGMQYATFHKMDIYVLNLYEQITEFFYHIKDYKKAYETRIIVNELATKYDALNISGKLLILEKDLINKRKDSEIKYERKILVLFIIITFILTALLIALFLLYNVNKKNKVLIKIDNQNLHKELEKLSRANKENNQNTINYNDYDLTARQKQIIKLVGQGKSNKEIGNELYISENTVKYHLKIIYNILNIHDRNSLRQ